MASLRALHRTGGVVALTVMLSGCFFGGGGTSNVITTDPAPRVNTGDVSDFEGTGSGNTLFADGIAATVNGRVITKSEVRENVLQERFLISRREADPKVRDRKIREVERLALDALIDRELKLEAYEQLAVPVKEHHVDERVNYVIRELYGGDREKFLEDLRNARPPITLRRFREQQVKNIKVGRMHGAITQNKVHPPTPSEIQAYYQGNLGNFRDEGKLRVRTISIPKLTRDGLGTPQSQRLLASDILAKLRKGADFAELAKTYSYDPSASQGGDRGFIERGTLNPLLDNVAFSLKEGEISDVVEGPTTYYILWAEERRYGRTAPLEEVREEIELRLMQERKQALVDEWVKARRNRAAIKVY